MATKKTSVGSTRDGFGEGLVALGHENNQVVGLCADLTESTRMTAFRDAFPERFIEVGVAEENMAGLAAGLALAGMIPYISSYAAFSPANSWGVIRASICYSNISVKIHGGHTGLVTGEDGATHQAMEDIALMRVLPNMSVVVPADKGQAFAATKAIASVPGPCYLRTSKNECEEVTKGQTFQFGKAQVLKKGRDVTIIACGSMVERALRVAQMLNGETDVAVINMHTIKPLDISSIIQAVKKTRAIVVAEEHQRAGGLGSAVAEVLVQQDLPASVAFVSMNDSFGESGKANDLIKKYGLDEDAIARAVDEVLSRKKHQR